MASTNRPLDESTATLVSPDDHLHTKDLLSTPTNASTAISSGTVSDEEPSTPEPLADSPVSVLCGWPHAHGPNGKVGHEGTNESGWPHLDDPKDPAAKNPETRPPVGTTGGGSGDWPNPGDDNKPDPAKFRVLKGTSNAGTDSTSKNDSVSVRPNADGPDGKTGHEGTEESGWPHSDDPEDQATKHPTGWPPVGDEPGNVPDLMPIPEPGDSSKPDPANLHPLKDNGHDGAESTFKDDSFSAQCGWPDGNASKPDPAKRGRQEQPGNGTDEAGTDATSKDDSVSVQRAWPSGNSSKPDPAKLQPSNGNDETQPETVGPERRKPGTVGPEGQPPWGVKNLAATAAANATSFADPEGQPPWGIKNFAATAANATSFADPEGQPPWGIKNLVNTKSVAGPEGQPPWGIKNLAAEGGDGPEGQPPWGTKGRAATMGGGNESGKGGEGAQDASA